MKSDDILKACRVPLGQSATELVDRLGMARKPLMTLVTALVKRGELHCVQRCNGGSPRYYTDWSHAQVARANNRLVNIPAPIVPPRNRNDRQAMNTPTTVPAVVLPTSAATVVPAGATHSVIGRTGSTTHIDRMAGHCAADRQPVRAGAMDFKAIPSLSPFGGTR